jgi:hypothetical protein
VARTRGKDDAAFGGVFGVRLGGSVDSERGTAEHLVAWSGGEVHHAGAEVRVFIGLANGVEASWEGANVVYILHPGIVLAGTLASPASNCEGAIRGEKHARGLLESVH